MPLQGLALICGPQSLVLFGLVALIGSQTPDTSNLGLVGDRFKPLTWDQMNPEQKTMTMNLLTGPRRGLGGPFNVLLRSPEMGDLAQKLGEYARFRPAVPAKLRELAIIVTARHWTAQYEWNAHRRAAAQAGLKEEIITGHRRPETSDGNAARRRGCLQLRQ